MGDLESSRIVRDDYGPTQSGLESYTLAGESHKPHVELQGQVTPRQKHTDALTTYNRCGRNENMPHSRSTEGVLDRREGESNDFQLHF